MSRIGIADPESFAADEASGFLVGTIIIPIIAALSFLIFMGALAFSGFLGGPYIIAKVLFFILLVPYAFFGILLFFLVGFVRTLSRNAVRNSKKMLHVDVTEL